MTVIGTSNFCFLFYFLPVPLASYGNQPKALVAGDVCHMVITAKIV
jgi:hypothetical protein